MPVSMLQISTFTINNTSNGAGLVKIPSTTFTLGLPPTNTSNNSVTNTFTRIDTIFKTLTDISGNPLPISQIINMESLKIFTTTTNVDAYLNDANAGSTATQTHTAVTSVQQTAMDKVKESIQGSYTISLTPTTSGFQNPNKNSEVQGYYPSNSLTGMDYHPF